MCSNLELSNDVVSMLQKQNEFLFKQMMQLKKESVKLHRLIQLNRWGHKQFAKDDETLDYMTGASSYAIFASLVQSLTEDPPSKIRMSPANQLFLTLMKVKLYVPDCYLKQLFHGINVGDVLSHWLPQLEQTLSRLFIWPLNKQRTNYILYCFNVRYMVQVGVLLTEDGTVCHVTQVTPSVTEKLLSDKHFLSNLHPGDRLVLAQSDVIYKVVKSPEGLRFMMISKIPSAITSLKAAKGVIEDTIEKLRSFAIFAGDVSEFRHMNLLVKISAALVNLHQGHVPKVEEDDDEKMDEDSTLVT